MPFPWLHPKRVPQRPRAAATMIHSELEQHAALLYRLGFSKPRARLRLLQNVVWDFEIGAGKGPSHQEVDAVVEGIYRRGGTQSGTPGV